MTRLTGALAFLLLCLETSAGSAQAVMRGRVVDESSLKPIPGAIVTALDGSGNPVASAFADPTGSFALSPLSLGAYLLTVDMIGRRSVSTEVALVQSDFFVLRMPSDPIRLAGINVSVPKRCSTAGGGDGEIALVWGEVQKALRAASLTRNQALYQFRVRGRDLERDRVTGALLEEDSEEREVTAYDPFESLPPEELAARGYIVEENGETWIYGPSLEVLLSRSFQDTHCFSLRRRRNQIGLSFEPVPGGQLSDIEGVLWLAEATGELRTLEFSYVRLPLGFIRGQYEGSARFRRLDAGSWAIDEWSLSAPNMDNMMRLRVRTGEILEVTKAP